MTALYLPPQAQTRTQSPSQLLRYLTEQTFRAVGSAIGTTGLVLALAGIFGAGS